MSSIIVPSTKIQSDDLDIEDIPELIKLLNQPKLEKKPETSDNKKRIFIYKSKHEFKHPNLGKHYLARISLSNNDYKLRKIGFNKTFSNELIYYIGIFDGIFQDWSNAKKIVKKIRNKKELEKFIMDYNINKHNKNFIVSEIFTN